MLIFADSHGYNMAMAFAVDGKNRMRSFAQAITPRMLVVERVFPAMPIYRVRGNSDFDPDVPLNAVVSTRAACGYITHGHP